MSGQRAAGGRRRGPAPGRRGRRRDEWLSAWEFAECDSDGGSGSVLVCDLHLRRLAGAQAGEDGSQVVRGERGLAGNGGDEVTDGDAGFRGRPTLTSDDLGAILAG